MLEVLNYAFPSPEQWDLAIKGMRLPKKSWDKSDSGICDGYKSELCQFCEPEEELGIHACDLEIPPITFVLGEKDKQLLLNLCKAGDPSHRKVLRQLPVVMDITAPLYFFKQFDTYKIGTTAQSESTMHCLVKEPFKLEDFSFSVVTDDPEYTQNIVLGMNAISHAKNTVAILNRLREEFLKTGDKKYWGVINEFLPQSYLQTRTWSANYETLVNIIQQRRGHKLDEWHTFCDYLLENVPYLKEIVEAVDG